MNISRVTNHGTIWQCKGRHGCYHSYSRSFCHLKKISPKGKISELNVLRLLILDGHGSHVIYIKSNTIGRGVWFKYAYITISYFSCFTTFECFMFQSFKFALKKERHEDMVKNNYVKLDKIRLIERLDKALDLTLFKITSNYG